MTVLDEVQLSKKYMHIELVEYYEWIARVSFNYYDLRKAKGISFGGQDAETVVNFRHD